MLWQPSLTLDHSSRTLAKLHNNNKLCPGFTLTRPLKRRATLVQHVTPRYSPQCCVGRIEFQVRLFQQTVLDTDPLRQFYVSCIRITPMRTSLKDANLSGLFDVAEVSYGAFAANFRSHSRSKTLGGGTGQRTTGLGGLAMLHIVRKATWLWNSEYRCHRASTICRATSGCSQSQTAGLTAGQI